MRGKICEARSTNTEAIVVDMWNYLTFFKVGIDIPALLSVSVLLSVPWYQND